MRRIPESSKAYLLFSTAGSHQEAKKIAALLVRNRLAACVNIIPKVDSIFRWRGACEQAKESLLVIKTNARNLKRLEEAIRKHHSYEVPEIIAWPIERGHAPYLRWLLSSVKR